jgi:hypothetical protein
MPDTNKSSRGRAARTAPQVRIEVARPTIRVNEEALAKTTVTGGAPPYRYQWWYDDKHVSSTTAPKIKWMMRTAGKHMVVVKVTDAAGNTVEARTEKSPNFVFFLTSNKIRGSAMMYPSS